MGLHDREWSDVPSGVHISVARPITSVVVIEPSRPAIVDQKAAAGAVSGTALRSNQSL
jgi:hypothetical protein